MGMKITWISLPKGGIYPLRPMVSERAGSDEMKARIAAKQGYYNASEYWHERKKAEPDWSRINELRRHPSHYSHNQSAYFYEGFALGLDMGDAQKHPFGELKSNGGNPMLPVMVMR
jgi:hypothetical protein